ncbi:MAG: DNA polymerase V [Candidatus Margulisbacteria bacterium GWF2_35_9]|nr:MAG: DNA polymerase V [Candidatus Margulisbacteria bacterium GWF2_35_9]
MTMIYVLIASSISFSLAWIIHSYINTHKFTRERTEKIISESKRESAYLQLDEAKDELRMNRETIVKLNASLSEKETQNLNLLEKLETQKQDLDKLQSKFSMEFENLANRIFDEKSSKFTMQNKDNMETILKPFGDKIADFKKKVEEVHTIDLQARSELQGGLNKLFELNQQMTKDAHNLTLALKGESKTQGVWGELILKRILEISGLQEGREFRTQVSFTNEEGKQQQPDVILNLPDNKNMIIDSKVSLTAYEKYYSEEDEEKRKRLLKDHVNSVRTHMKLLSQKNYQHIHQMNSPDFVLMFLPIDPAFGLALQNDPNLYSDAFEMNIIIVSPLSLLATLKTISSIWRTEYQNRNAMEIARQGGDLYDKFVGFIEDLKRLGSQIQTSQNTYEDALKKLSTGKGNLVHRAEKIKKLGAKTNKCLPMEMLDI